ncbi:MAG: trypsin-like peptidase domain-containing protein, partial [Actinomycetota bacterium]
MDSVQFIDALIGGEASAAEDAAAPLLGGSSGSGDVLDAYSLAVTSVAERLMPSVASLKVERRTSGGRRAQGAGSGVVITPDGLLLTSAHVITQASGGTASFTDGRELDFEVVGADPLSDLAVVRAAGSDLVPAALGDADA